jgi:hypothetical protein
MQEVLNEILTRLALPGPEARTRDDLFAAFAAATRKVGRTPLTLADDLRARLVAAGVDWPLVERTDDLYRVALLVNAAHEPAFVGLVTEVFRAGDSEERRAVLRALPVLPGPERFVELAIDACRTNVVPIFEAIAAENPYPARHFPDLHFHQLVLKAVFLGVRLPRVLGLAARVDPELARMADDYAAERRAAGRSVPEDLALLAHPSAHLPAAERNAQR